MLIRSSSLIHGFRNLGSRGMSSGNRFAITVAISYFVFAPDSEKARLTLDREKCRVIIAPSSAMRSTRPRSFCTREQRREPQPLGSSSTSTSGLYRARRSTKRRRYLSSLFFLTSTTAQSTRRSGPSNTTKPNPRLVGSTAITRFVRAGSGIMFLRRVEELRLAQRAFVPSACQVRPP
jgi:hypothetical protein